MARLSDILDEETPTASPVPPPVEAEDDPITGYLKRQGRAAKKIGTEVATGVTELGRTAATLPTLLGPKLPHDPVREEAEARAGGLRKMLDEGLEGAGKVVEGDPGATAGATKLFFPLLAQIKEKGVMSALTDPVETAWNAVNTVVPARGLLGAAIPRAAELAATKGSELAGRTGERLFKYLPDSTTKTRLLTAAEKLPEKTETLVRKVIPKYDYTPEMYNVMGGTEGALHRGNRFATETGRAFQELYQASPDAAAAVSTVMDPTIKSVEKLHTDLAAAIAGQPKAQQAAELSKLGRATQLTMDPVTGAITYGDSAAYQALTPAQKGTVDRVRNALIAPVMALHDMGAVDVDKAVEMVVSNVRQKYLADFTATPGHRPLESMPRQVKDDAITWLMRGHANIVDPQNPAKSVKITTRKEAEDYLEQLLVPNKREAYEGNFARERTLEAIKSRYGGRLPSALEDALGPLRAEPGRTNWTQGVTGLAPGEAGAIAVAQTISDLNWMVQNRRALDQYRKMTTASGEPLIVSGGDLPPKGYKELHQGTTAHGLPIAKGEKFYYHPAIQDSVEMMHGNAMSASAGPLLRMVKWGLVVPNLRTWTNNIASNFQYSTLAGASALNPKNWDAYRRAFTEITQAQRTKDFTGLYSQKDRIFKEAVDGGIIAPQSIHAEMADIYGGDLLRSKDVHTFAEGVAKRIMENPASRGTSKLYEAQDMLFKYGSYRALRERGWSPEAARAEVLQAYPGYQTTSQLGRWFRGQESFTVGPISVPAGLGPYVGSPFASFPLEHNRIMVNAAKNHPWRLMAAASIPSAMRGMAMAVTGMGTSEWFDFQQQLNQGTSPKGSYIPLGGGKTDRRVAEITDMFPTERWLQHPFSGGLPVTMLSSMYKAGAKDPTGFNLEDGLTEGALAVVPPAVRDVVGSARHAIQGTQRNPADSLTAPSTYGVPEAALVPKNLAQGRTSPVKIRKLEDLTTTARKENESKVKQLEGRFKRTFPFEQPDKTESQLGSERQKLLDKQRELYEKRR